MSIKDTEQPSIKTALSLPYMLYNYPQCVCKSLLEVELFGEFKVTPSFGRIATSEHQNCANHQIKIEGFQYT